MVSQGKDQFALHMTFLRGYRIQVRPLSITRPFAEPVKPGLLSVPRRRVTPVEEGSTQTVVDLIWLSLPFIPSCLPKTARLSGTDIIFEPVDFCNRPWARSSQCSFRRIVPANLCKGMRMSAASTSPQRGIDRTRAGVVRPRGVRNDDADRRPWARKRPFRTRPAERVVHPVCPCRSTGGSLNRDNSRGMSQECAAKCPLVEDDRMVQAFAPHAADQAFHIRIFATGSVAP